MALRRLTHDEVTRHVAVSPQQVYDLVADVTRTPDWSPEVVGCTWLDGATGPAVGARFAARNRRRWFRWTNRPVVDVADPGREFAFTRTERGGGSIRWRYRLQPEGDGTSVEHSYEVLEPVPRGLHVMLRLAFGVRDLSDDLHANMEHSLTRLAAVAEAGYRARSAGSALDEPSRSPSSTLERSRRRCSSSL
ncbi:MAG: hypothetical protein QOE59_3221 [Actinomycetota bacterium]|jgi:polyketide cyclase/dehydrase/lipid transport protein|nr:hypothetical protein [Actinomycetota bacterium]